MYTIKNVEQEFSKPIKEKISQWKKENKDEIMEYKEDIKFYKAQLIERTKLK